MKLKLQLRKIQDDVVKYYRNETKNKSVSFRNQTKYLHVNNIIILYKHTYV